MLQAEFLIPGMSGATESLLKQVETYCRRAGIAESTFGRQAVNDGKLCARLRAGRNVTLETAQRIRDYIDRQSDAAVNQAGESEAGQNKQITGGSSMTHVTDDRPFRFYDNRQKYLAFVNTCNEKWKVAERATQELTHVRPSPPALRLFDAGVGDGTVLGHMMRAMHRRFPTIPFFRASIQRHYHDQSVLRRGALADAERCRQGGRAQLDRNAVTGRLCA
jgi:hypothetical protein